MANNPKIERSRYIAITYGYNRVLSQSELWKLISGYCHNLFGLKGLIEMGLYLNFVSPKPFAIFRISSNSINKLLMTFASCRKYNNEPIVFFSLSISGTIKGLKDLENSLIVENLISLNMKS
ncbi:MAG: Rpp14/Pop5 family protein [Candidatus Hodarchaeales archaeon]|jgi:RNase P/RNase MRP subunit POP5